MRVVFALSNFLSSQKSVSTVSVAISKEHARYLVRRCVQIGNPYPRSCQALDRFERLSKSRTADTCTKLCTFAIDFTWKVISATVVLFHARCLCTYKFSNCKLTKIRQSSHHLVSWQREISRPKMTHILSNC